MEIRFNITDTELSPSSVVAQLWDLLVDNGEQSRVLFQQVITKAVGDFMIQKGIPAKIKIDNFGIQSGPSYPSLRYKRSLGAMAGEGWGVKIRTAYGKVMDGNFFEMPFLPNPGHTITYTQKLYRVTSVHIDYDESEIHIQVERLEDS